MIQRLKAVVAVVMAATTVASADEVAALFGKAEYTGDVTDRIVFSEIQCDRRYDIEGICSLRVDNINEKHVTYLNNKFLHWYKSDCLTVTPEPGVAISGIEFYCTTADYCHELTASTGTALPDRSVPVTIWEGNTAEPFTLAADAAQIRVSYAIITYAPESSSSIDTVTDNYDPDVPAEYYNLQGIRVGTPSPGIYIRRQGSSVSKVYINNHP